MSNSITIAKIFPRPVNDIRKRLTKISSKVLAEAGDVTEVVYGTLQRQRKLAVKTLSRAGRKAMRLSRRYPAQTITAALVLGFLIGRSRR